MVRVHSAKGIPKRYTVGTSETRGERGTFFFGLNGYVPLNRICFSGSRALNGVHNFTISFLEHGAFLDQTALKEC